MIGHIKIDRKILNWEWYQDHKTFHLFLYILLKANHKEGKWQGNDIKRGQLITGRFKISRDTGLTESEIRTCLNRLKTTNEIAIKTTKQFSLITISKYDYYQSSEKKVDQQINQPFDQQIANESPTNHQQIATNNNVNNKEEGKEVFNTMPLPENFNGLPKDTKDSANQLLVITKKVRLTDDDFSGLWAAFKKQHLDGKTYYANENKVYTHFINWAKKQSFENGKPITKSTGSTGKQAGLEALLERGKQKFATARENDSST